MKIVIVGGGALGRVFGSYLVRGGSDITLIDRNEQVLEALREKGIGLLESDGDLPDDATSYNVEAYNSASSIGKADLVLLLVKSQSTLPAVKDTCHLITDDCPLLSIQAGLGNIEIAKKLLGDRNVLVGTSYLTGTALSEARVRKGGSTRTYLGELNGQATPRLERIADIFNECGIETQISSQIIGRLWSKVIVHAAINPLSAILQVPNGVLTSRMESITLMKRLLDEGMAVARSCAVELVYDDHYEQLFKACERSSNNLSSMLQDILNEFPTEVDAQNGAICRYAESQGLSVPTHQTMVEIIKLLECWKPGLDRL